MYKYVMIFLMLATQVVAAQEKVSGTVTDEKKQPEIGRAHV